MFEKKRIKKYLKIQKNHIPIANSASATTLAWIQNLKDYLTDLFGDGEVVNQLNKLSFRSTDDRNYVEFILDDAIQRVDIGAYIQKDRKNFLRKLSDAWLIAIMSLIAGVILPTVYWIGFWFGTHSNTINQNPKADTAQKAKTK